MLKMLGLAVAMTLLIQASAEAVTYRNTPTLGRALLGVGQSIIINGVRGEPCGATPPTFNQIKPQLPTSRRGMLSDGGVGWRFSNSCNRWVRVRAVEYKALKAGQESLTIFGDTTIVTTR